MCVAGVGLIPWREDKEEVLASLRNAIMAVQIVMDRNGDTRHQFDHENSASLETAMERFDRLTSQGYRAVALEKSDNSGRLLNGFESHVERTLFIPQLKGG